ncbi:unnamed protein product [Bursaphelenchus okinawaensis]|uniref:PDZ domain-containing protein n=1 Tax=Bursaphelenchus okinawaensis TaxID=465554 RepID=A0A811LJP6_9BILA|nr:unnamed protein product [Bursaphelenchus okinawaensis]CAG9123191.1 unnamed protein product [Bursaphelenchus okinawaensis]
MLDKSNSPRARDDDRSQKNESIQGSSSQGSSSESKKQEDSQRAKTTLSICQEPTIPVDLEELKRIQIGDRLIDVDGTPINNRETAKKLMLKSLASTRKVSFIIERPQSSEAKLYVKTALLSASTRTSSTAPREKAKWAARAAQQRKNAANHKSG